MLLAALTSLLLASAPASAQNMALDPQVRAHAGLNVVGGPSGIGFTGGMDSRLTTVLALDIGAFASPVLIGDEYHTEPGLTLAQYSQLRHGVYATPGLRIRHPQPKRWAWDVFLRAGGGVLWTADLDPESKTYFPHEVRPAAGGLGGVDALVRFGQLGIRASGKVWMYSVLQDIPSQKKSVFI